MFKRKEKPVKLPASFTSMIEEQQQRQAQENPQPPKTESAQSVDLEDVKKRLKKVFSKYFCNIRFVRKNNALYMLMRRKSFIIPHPKTVEMKVTMKIKDNDAQVSLDPKFHTSYTLFFIYLIISFVFLPLAFLLFYQAVTSNNFRLYQNIEECFERFPETS